MTQPSTVEDLFLDALDRPPADRAAFLEEACAGDPGRLRRVRELLAAHDRPVGPLDAPAVPSPLADLPPAADPLGTLIGPYKLVQVMGEGGMGTVYLAQQTEPVKRLVALKVIKAGMDTAQVIARFEAERQALALMDHPNIAKVFDAGTTPEGRPYFVMELVKGVPITKYCDDHHLTPRERLELFVPVCQAVQHAHQKGVIHRDLKPSNVLVAPYDGRPVPKVIDFGVAKAAGQPLTERTLVTGLGAMVGTLEYMSPEQAELNNLDVDTRSDVYSLGVLLYELLTGTTPLSGGRLQREALLEALRLVREEEPPRPSRRLSASGEALASISARRHTEPARLTRLVRGELDWIVMKALEKDRTRRYETANGFAMDVQRYLNDETVQACPPSAAYRVRKFVRRNRRPVLAAGLVLLALLAGVAVSAWQAVRATTARQAEAGARHTAEESEADTRAYARFLAEHVLAATRPEGMHSGVGFNVTLADALAKAEPALDEVFRGRPRAEALARYEIGVTWQSLGRYPEAIRHLRRALDLRRDILGPRSEDTLRTAYGLAAAYRDAGQFDQSLALCEEAMSATEEGFGPDHDLTLTGRNHLALTHEAAGRLDQAVPLFEVTVARRRAAFGPDHPETLAVTDNLAGAYKAAGRLDEALRLYEAVSATYRNRFGPDHPDTLTSRNNLAVAYTAAGRADRAVSLCQETLAQTKEKFGPDHHLTLVSMHNLALAHAAAGPLDRAIALNEEVLAKAKARPGPDHPFTLTTMNTLASAYWAAGRFDKAVPLFEQALARQTEALGPDHPSTLHTMNNLANAYQAAGRLDRALPLSEKAFRLMKAKLGPDHPDTLVAMSNVVDGRRAAGKPDVALCEEALKLIRARHGPDHPTTLNALNNLALAHLETGDRGRALPLLKETLELRRAKLGRDHADTLVSLSNLASGYGREQVDLALPLLREVLELRTAKLGADHPSTLRSLNNLATAYEAAGQFGRALPLFRDALARRREALGPDHPDTLGTMSALAAEYERAGLHDQAEPLLREQAEYWRKKAGADSPAHAGQLAALGLNLLRQARSADAEPLLRASLAVREAKEPDDWRTFSTKTMLGGALLGQKKYAEAEPLLVQGYEGLKQREAKVPAQGKARLTEALERLVEFYDALGKPGEATRWRAELAARKAPPKEEKDSPPKK